MFTDYAKALSEEERYKENPVRKYFEGINCERKIKHSGLYCTHLT